MQPVEVVFCGNSIYLCGLAAGLQQMEHLRMRIVDSAPEKAMPDLKMLCPDVVIFESADNSVEMIKALRAEGFHWMIIIVYPQTDSLKVFWREPCWVASVDELERIIHTTYLLHSRRALHVSKNNISN